MIVEIDLFSGRPNPRWQVDEGVRGQVLAVEVQLKPAVRGDMELPGLGYRGFIYEDGGVMRRAFAGMLERDSVVYKDPTNAMERLLLESMPVDLVGVRKRVLGLLS